MIFSWFKHRSVKNPFYFLPVLLSFGFLVYTFRSPGLAAASTKTAQEKTVPPTSPNIAPKGIQPGKFHAQVYASKKHTEVSLSKKDLAEHKKLSSEAAKRTSSPASLALIHSLKIQREHALALLLEQNHPHQTGVFALISRIGTQLTASISDALDSISSVVAPDQADSTNTPSLETPSAPLESSSSVPLINQAPLDTSTSSDVVASSSDQVASSDSSTSTQTATPAELPTIVSDATSTTTASTTPSVNLSIPAVPAIQIAPTFAEANTDTGKIVQISAPDLIPAPTEEALATTTESVASSTPSSATSTPEHLTNVLAYTNIPPIYKVGEENKIHIKWKNNGNQDMEFHAYSLHHPGYLDYVEWTVPHLSTQTFEIIFVTKALELDENNQPVADIYDQVANKDSVVATVPAGHTVRTTFKQILDNTKDITLYAAPTDPAVPTSIEVRDDATGALITTFPAIARADWYKVLLTNVQNPSDVFDLKVTGGSANIDYIVDPTGWLTGWAHRKKVTISNANVGSDLTDFPALVKFTADSDLAAALSSGADIRFTDSGGSTLLKYERESWQGGGGSSATGIFWVKVPTVSSSANTDLYVYYGNAGASDGADPTNVWTNGYAAVWHLNDASNPTIHDSTANGNDGTNNGVTSVVGPFGAGAGSFDGVSSYINAANSPSLDITGNSISYGAWVYPKVSDHYQEILAKSNGADRQYAFFLTQGNTSGIYRNLNNGLSHNVPISSPWNTHTWNYIYFVYDGSTEKIYLNGNQVYSGPASLGNIGSTNHSVSLGYSPNEGYVLDGYLADARVSTVAHSADWFNFEYHNQADAGNDLTIANQENNGIWLSGWNNRQKITIDHTKVGSGTEDETDFPVLVSIPGLQGPLANGADIRFTADDGGSYLAREIVSYTGGPETPGTLTAWVKVPHLSHVTDTTLYVYYGNASATEPVPSSTYGSQSVWSNGYAAVWHLTDPTNPTDSTGNGNDGTDHGVTATTGPNGLPAGLFDGSSYIDSKAVLPGGQAAYTIEAWYNPVAASLESVYEQNSQSLVAGKRSAILLYGGSWGFNGESNDVNSIPVQTNQWTHAVITVDTNAPSNPLHIYSNGSLVFQGDSGGGASNLNVGTYKSAIGHKISSGGEIFNGKISEVRVSSLVRSSGWVATEFSNQNDISAFATTDASVVSNGQIVWTDGSGDGKWSTAGNWQGGVVPGMGDVAVFNSSATGNATIDTDESVKGVQIASGYSGTITQSGGNTLTLGTGGFSQAGGTFAGGSGAIFDAGNFSLSGGAFTSTSGTLSVAGAFTHSAGTWSANGGTVLLTNTSDKALTLSAPTQFANLNLNDGLVGYWKLDEASGTVVHDSSGYGNDGANTGVAISSDVPTTHFANAKSLSFDGTHVVTTNTPLSIGTGDFSLSSWIKTTTIGNEVYFSNSGGDWPFMYLDVGQNGVGKVLLHIDNNLSGGFLTSTSLVNDGRWHNIIVKRAQGTASLYVDGVQEDQAHISDSVGSHPIVFGSFNGYGYFYTGKLDDFRIYNRALSADEIAALATGNEPGTSIATTTVTGGDLSVGGNLTLNSGTLDTGTQDISLAGNWENNGGIFVPNTQTVTLNGTNQSINSSNTFYNFTKSVSSADTLTFAASSTQTIAHTLALSGAAGNLLSLRSSQAGMQWKIDPQGTRTISYLDVKDSNNINAAAIVTAGQHIMNSGNNTGWVIDSTPPVVVVSSPANSSASGSSVNFSASASDETSLGFLVSDLDSSLVSWWKGDITGGTTVADSVGGNDGTIHGGVTPSVGKFGSALSLNGTNGYVSIQSTTLPTGSSPRTVSLWVKANSWAGSDGIGSGLFTYGSTGSNHMNLLYVKPNGTIGVAFYLNDYDTGVTPASVGTWSHIVMTYDGNTTLKLYKDGVQAYQNTSITPPNTTLGSLGRIGSYGGDSYNSYFNGQIDDTMVFNKALTADEVRALYDGTAISHALTLSGGSHTYKAYAEDLAGNVGSSATSTFSVDIVAPTTSADGNGYTFGDESASDVSVALSCSDANGTGCATTLYCVDTDNSCTPATTYSAPVAFSTEGTSYIRYASTDVAGNAESVKSGAVTINKTQGWLGGWNFRKKITISHANVGSTNLSHFPLLVRFFGDSDLAQAQANGADIRFTQSNGTSLLSYERETWQGGAGSAATSTLWVKIPVISHTVDTDIYVYYGNSSASDGQDATNVWTNGYVGVWHLNDAGNATIHDSTANGNDGTNHGVTRTDGLFGTGAGVFDGGAGNITFSDASLPIGNQQKSVSAWIKTTEPTLDRYFFADGDQSSGNRYFYLGVYQRKVFLLTNGVAGYVLFGTSNVNDGQWHHVVVSHDGSTVSIYVDGLFESSAPATFDIPLTGTAYIGGISQGSRYTFNGEIDNEVVLNRALTPGWINFEYKNQIGNNELSFAARESSDVTAPDTTDDYGAKDNIWQAGAQTITLTPHDNATGVAWTKYCVDSDNTCLVDATQGTDYSSPVTIAASSSAETLYFRYASADNAGNVQSVVSRSVKIDQTTPVISNIAPVDGSHLATGDAITFTLNKTGDCRLALSDTALSYDGMASSTICFVANGIQMSCVAPDLGAAGIKNIYLACEDYLGNKDASTTATHLSYVVPAASTPVSSGGGGARFFPGQNGPSGTLGIAINEGAPAASSRNVTLSLMAAADSGVNAVLLATNPDFRGAVTLPYASRMPFDLCQGTSVCVDGSYAVYVRFLNAQGFASPAFAAHITVNTSSFSQTLSHAAKGLGETIAGAASDIVSTLFPSAPAQITLPPASIPDETPLAFQGKWKIVTPSGVQNLVFAELPKDIKDISKKFPEVGEVLQKVGIRSMNDSLALNSTSISLPSFGETLGVLPEDVKVANLTVSDSVKIPTDIVFARTADEKIDLNAKLSIGNEGLALQTLNTVQGQSLKFVVRPESAAKQVLGYLIFKSAKAAVKNAAAHTASVSDAFTSISASNDTSVAADLVLSQFEYKNSGNGLWVADVPAPQATGQYELRTVVNYTAPKKAPTKISMVVVVDPEGYVYQKLNGGEFRITNAVVSIYWQNPETKAYELWPAQDFRQVNPQTTDVTGRYSFLVPPGTYYLKADAEGYNAYQSDPFIVEASKGVFMNIEMKPQWSFKNAFSVHNALLGMIVVLLGYFAVRKRRWAAP